MIPAWVWTFIIVTCACVLALWLGSFLSASNPWWMLGAISLLAVAIVCAAHNNFPFLYALGCWIPFFPHLLPFGSFPTFGYFLIWMGTILFLQLCVKGYLSYRQSFDWPVLICLFWIPVRFLMNPVHKLGSTAGGSGVSGASPYFNYAMVIVLLIVTGAILNNRSKVIYYMRWCFVVALISGLVLTACAFVPATAPFLRAMGTFAAGDISDGIQRLVQLPGYGLFIIQGAMCPALMRLKFWQSFTATILGLAMIVIGGNRCAVAAACIFIPVVLLLRRKSNALFMSLVLMTIFVVGLNIAVTNMEAQNIPIPGLIRSFGIFDSKIDDESGGTASAEWRYDVWRNALKTIMESPLTGKGFGNLPQHVETEEAAASTDFETVLAGGEAHNGFINCAYGFGIPFSVALASFIVIYFLKESSLALVSDKNDRELRDLHAFLGATFACFPVLIYSAFDLSASELWISVAISCIASRLPSQEIRQVADGIAQLRKYGENPRPVGPYSYRPR